MMYRLSANRCGNRPWIGQPSKALASLLGALLLGQACSARADIPREEIRLEASDGIEIVADYFAPPSGSRPAPGVVLVHMLRVDRSSWAPLIPTLHTDGLAVLAIDLRGHGESGAPQLEELRRRVRAQDIPVFHEMHRDVAAAVSWLTTQDDVDPSRLALIGATIGFSVALDYAVRDPSIDAVVGLTPGSGFIGMDSVAGTLMYGKRPMLLLAVDTDRRAVETLSRMNPLVVGEIVGNGTGHGTRMLEAYDQTPGRILEFVREKLASDSTAPVVFALGEKKYYADLPGLRAAHPDIDLKLVRWCSSEQEAKERGMTAAAAQEAEP